MDPCNPRNLRFISLAGVKLDIYFYYGNDLDVKLSKMPFFLTFGV